jgi:regulator of sigma E protease
MSWVLTVAGFAALVVLHELGHFMAAKATGMRVERFFLFFPPKVVSVRRGETEYGVGAVPLGGFVKITGMNPDEDLPPEVAPRAYYAQPVWRRIVVIAAGPAMNLVIALVILFALALHQVELTHKVGAVSSGSPAAAADLRPGDRIVAVDGVRGGFAKLRHQIASHHCAGKPRDGCRATTAAQVRVIRDGRPLTFRIHPEYETAGGIDRNVLGINWGTTLVPASPGDAASTATTDVWRVTSGTVGAIARLFEPEQRSKLSGIVGASDVTHQAFSYGARDALTLLAIISLSLAVINLFPFLPLDGGHIFWSLVEKLRGRPVSFDVIERASAVGFVLVMILFAIGLSNDISRLTGPGIHLR